MRVEPIMTAMIFPAALTAMSAGRPLAPEPKTASKKRAAARVSDSRMSLAGTAAK
jgi:hypothetical protein